MHSGILLIFCSSITLVKNFPVQVFDYFDPLTGHHELIELRDDDYEYYSNIEHKQKKKSILDPCLQSQNGDVKCFFEDERRKENFEENLKLPMLPYFGAYGQFQDEQEVFERYPYDFESSLAIDQAPFLNPSSIPMSHGTYIHGLEEPQEPAPTFNTDVYEAQDMLPLTLRMARRTSYEDFLDQLSHDAMMNNILPTMSYVRNSGYEVPYGPANAVAYFPHAGPVTCAQPVLFGCSPTIFQGHLGNWPHPNQMHLPLNGHGITISNDGTSNHKVGHDKVRPLSAIPNQGYRKVHMDLVPTKKD